MTDGPTAPDWAPPEPDGIPCRGGCGKVRRYVWQDGPPHGPSWRRGRWVAPSAYQGSGLICPECQAAAAAAQAARAEAQRLASRPVPWPPDEPIPLVCQGNDCTVVQRWTWREGPWDGPAHQRGRREPPPTHLCPEHQAEAVAARAEQQLRDKLAASGLPQRLQGYRWDRVLEYRDSAGQLVPYDERGRITHAAFQRYQARLPEDTLGITPWNKALAGTLRALCKGDASVLSWLIMGPVGSGKSTLVAATVAGLLARGLDCYYLTEADLWARVRQQWGQTSKAGARRLDVVQALVDMPVLALDDLGTIESPKPWHVDGMERLVCGRYDTGRPMLITTNATVQELADTYGERVGSRLVEMIGRGRRYMRLGGPDWRTGLVRVEDLPAAATASTTAEPEPEPEPTDTTPCPDCGYHPCRRMPGCED